MKEGNIEDAPERYSEVMTWDLHLNVEEVVNGQWDG